MFVCFLPKSEQAFVSLPVTCLTRYPKPCTVCKRQPGFSRASHEPAKLTRYITVTQFRGKHVPHPVSVCVSFVVCRRCCCCCSVGDGHVYVLSARAKLHSLEKNTFLILCQSVLTLLSVVAVVRSVMDMCMCFLQEPSYTVERKTRSSS